MIVVTEVTGHGSIRRGVLDTAACSDADRFKDLIEQAALDLPPPYQPVTGRPLYQIRADDTISGSMRQSPLRCFDTRPRHQQSRTV